MMLVQSVLDEHEYWFIEVLKKECMYGWVGGMESVKGFTVYGILDVCLLTALCVFSCVCVFTVCNW